MIPRRTRRTVTHFSQPPAGLKVKVSGAQPETKNQVEQRGSEYERGKAEATHFYQAEIRKLRRICSASGADAYNIDQKTKDAVSQLDDRLPDLVVGLSERVLGKING